MRKLKPALVVLLISTMILGLMACGVKDPQSNPTESGSEEQSGTGDSQGGSEVETGDSETGSEPDSEIETETGSGTDSETESETGSEQELGTEPSPDGYTIKVLDKTMWATTGVNVRSLPSTEGTIIGGLVRGQEIKVTGQCNENDWYRVEYNGATGYVSNKYLSDEKPVDNTPAPGEPNATVDKIKDVLGKTPKKAGSLYVIGNAGFEGYSFNDTLKDRAETYAQLMTQVADALKGVSNVYVMPIPLGSGVCLPDEYKGKVSAGDQAAAIDYILGHMGANAVAVDIFDTLYAHRDEYLYFRTDHHWTQLAAYYAYTDYCKAKGIEAFGLDHFVHKAYGGFVGSFYFNHYENYKSTVNALYNAPDIVYTYAPVSDAQMIYTKTDGTSTKWPIIKDVSNYKTGVKYSCFIAGDNPYTIIENKDVQDGSSCIVVKESYGNAFVPLLVDHYQTIHVIDQRYWKGNVIDFAKKHNVTDVIFANNLTAIGSKTQLKYFKNIIE